MNLTAKFSSYKEELEKLQSNLGEMMPEEVLSIFNGDADLQEKTHQSILKLKVGDKAPDFSLANATGEIVSLHKLLENGPVVLTFYRGSWCPFCNLQLNHYQQRLEEIASLDGQLVAISPQTPDESLSLKEKNDLKFHVLSDNGNIVAERYTTVFKNKENIIATMGAMGIDFNAFYADDSQKIPVPAVFVIKKDHTVAFAKAAGGDYRNRVEGTDIIKALENIK